MVLPKLSNDDVKEIQQLLKEGHSGKELAKKYGVSPSIISRRAKTPYLERFIPLKTKNNIIKKIKEGYTKAEAAQMYDVPVNTVLGFTTGLPSGKSEGNHIIRKNGIELLGRLMKDGYLISDFVISTVRGLQMKFPVIKSARYRDKTFFYPHRREEETIEAFFNIENVCFFL
jgi:Helix-turn-helix domain